MKSLCKYMFNPLKKSNGRKMKNDRNIWYKNNLFFCFVLLKAHFYGRRFDQIFCGNGDFLFFFVFDPERKEQKEKNTFAICSHMQNFYITNIFKLEYKKWAHSRCTRGPKKKDFNSSYTI